MNEIIGDAWVIAHKYDALCILTNGTIKADGDGVMGRGIALEACYKVSKDLPTFLGENLTAHGNHTQILAKAKFPKKAKPVILIQFPTKWVWNMTGSYSLIKRSLEELLELATVNQWEHILLPRPGCGNAKLDWKKVKVACGKLLDDPRLTIISRA